MGGKSSAPQTTTTKVEFADEQKPYITDIFERAQQGFNEIDQKRFNGPTYAAANADQLGALDQVRALSSSMQGYGDPTAAAAQGLYDNVNSGYYTDQLNDAFVIQDPAAELQGAIAAAVDPLQRQLLESILPELSNGAIEQGAYGGSKFQDLQGDAIRGFSDQALNVASTLSYEDLVRRQALEQKDLSERRGLAPALFQSEQNAALLGSNLLEAAAGQNLVSSNLLQEAGNEQQRLDQAKINANIADFQRSLTEPFTGLDIYSSFIQGFGTPTGGTSTATGGGGGRGGFSGGLSGAAGGAALGSVVPGIGTGIGAVLGGLAGYF